MLIILINILYWLLLLLALLLIPFNIPGNLIIAGLHLVYMIVIQGAVNWELFSLLAVLAGIAELIEFFISMKSTQHFGGSQKSMLAAVAGSIFGAFIGSGILLLIGTLIGAMVGAFIGSFLVDYLENRDTDRALKTGLGAFTGVAGGKMTKIILAIIMLVMIGINI